MGTKRWISVGVLTALLAGIASLPAAAQAPESPALSSGPWAGIMSIEGNATGLIEGVEVDLRADLSGSFDLDVGNEFTENDPNQIGGVESYPIVGGGWSLAGTSYLDIPVPQADGKGFVDWNIAASGGFEGDASVPVHAGTVDSSGTFTVTVPQGTSSGPVGPHTQEMAFEVRLDSTTCNEAYGDFSISLAEIMQQQGLTTAFEGPWVAYRNSQEVIDAVDSWREEMRGITNDGAVAPGGEAVPEIVLLFGQLLAEFNAWVDEYQASVSGADNEALWLRTTDLINDQAVFLARLRNLSECDAELIDPELLEKFDTLIKTAMLTEIKVLVEERGLNADQLTTVSLLALNAGALGVTGPEPIASEAEEALRKATEEILLVNVVSGAEDGTGIDGLDISEPEVPKALALAASMHWTFTVNGVTYAAAKVWENYERQVAEGGNS